MIFPIENVTALIEYFDRKYPGAAINGVRQKDTPVGKLMDIVCKELNGDHCEELSRARAKSYDPNTFVEVWNNKSETCLGVMLKRPTTDSDLENMWHAIHNVMPDGYDQKLVDTEEDKEDNCYVYTLKVKVPHRHYHENYKDVDYWGDDQFDREMTKGKWTDD